MVLDSSHEMAVCEYCLANYIVKQDNNIQEIVQSYLNTHYSGEKDIEELLKEGFDLIESNNIELANAKFKKVIEKDQKCWNAWLGYALSFPTNYNCLDLIIKAFNRAYDLSRDEQQQIETYTNMINYIPDSQLQSVFLKAYNISSELDRKNLFNVVTEMIGKDESDIARLAVKLCAEDWRAYFALARFRQIRAKWSKLQGIFVRGLSQEAEDVKYLFVYSYVLAKKYKDIDGTNYIMNYLENLRKDSAYTVFANEVIKYLNLKVI